MSYSLRTERYLKIFPEEDPRYQFYATSDERTKTNSNVGTKSEI